jgi:predicted Zn finger-like uncharacterized protein
MLALNLNQTWTFSMILTCPQCATRYQVDGAQFPAEGRKVRCAKCGHVWQQDSASLQHEAAAAIESPEPAPVIAAPPVSPPPRAPEPSPAVGPAEALGPERAEFAAPVLAARPIPEPKEPPKERRPESVALAVGWLGLLAVVVVIGWCAVHFRQAIASAWPQSASLYSVIGMKVNSRGIDISDVVSHRSVESGATILSISGDLTNITSHDVPVPTISIRLTDDDQHELDHWTFAAAKTVLKPGQRIPFSTRRTNPPEDARHLEVTFAEAGG